MPYMSFGDLAQEQTFEGVIHNYDADMPADGMSDYYTPAAEKTPGMLSNYNRYSGSMRVSPWVHGPMPDPNLLNAALGQFNPVEMAALRKLDRRIVAVIMDEMKGNVEAQGVIKELLRAPDPEKAIKEQIAAELMQATGIGEFPGMGDLGKISFKKVKKGFSKTIKKVTAPVMKAVRKYGPTAIMVAGAVLSPFTGGASLAAAAVIQAGLKVTAEKKAAAAAKKMAKKEAAAMEAEAQQAEMGLRNQVNDFYKQNEQMFASMGFTPDKWNAMSLNDKLAVMDKLATGELKPPASAPPVADIEPPSHDVPAPTETQPPPPPVADGKFKVVVEGAEVGAWGSVEDAAKGALGLTSPGDRFVVIADGKSTGLRIRTGTGAVAVPANMAAQVNAMTPDQVKDSVAKAEEKKSGGFPIWLLAVPAAAVVAAVR